MPKFCLRYSKISFTNAFVNISANWSSEMQNSKWISPLFTNSLIKWNLVSTCLLLLWKTWFFDNAIVDLLSQKIGVDSFYICNKSVDTLLIQIAWHAANMAATYSASADESVTMGCFLDAPYSKMKGMASSTLLVINATYKITINITNQTKIISCGI